MSPRQIFDIVAKYLEPNAAVTSAIFNTLRILKQLNKGDTYYESYLSHYHKYGAKFVDSYHTMWGIGAEIRPKRILEIGCRVGTSCAQVLGGMVDFKPDKITLIDIFNDGYNSPNIVKMNLRHMNLLWDCIEIITADSKEWMEKCDETFDYILIDGDHAEDAARRDLRNAVRLLDSGGILVFDDISVDGCNLDKVWQEFKEINANEFLFAENYDGKGVGVGVKK